MKSVVKNELNLKLLVLLIFISFFSQAQNFEKLFKNEKFQVAEFKINKKLVKINKKQKKSSELSGDKSLILFYKSKLFNNKKFSKFSPDSSIVFINNSLANYSLINEKEKLKLIKKKVTLAVLHLEQNNCYDLGLEIAHQNPSVESYDHFINTFSESKNQLSEAIKYRNIYAFKQAKLINTEDNYIEFISKYSESEQIDSAIILRDVCAFNSALQEMKSSAFKSFLDKYPNSHLVDQANFEKNKYLFIEQTDGSLKGYIRFCQKNDFSDFYKRSIDSIEVISLREKDTEGLKFIFNNHNRLNDFTVFQDKVMDLYLFDGQIESLNNLENIFTNKFDYTHQKYLEKLRNEIEKIESLYLKIGVNSNNYSDYKLFIKEMAPKDISWVALQRLLESDLKNKNWIACIQLLNEFEKYFQKDSTNRVTDLINILNEQDRIVPIEKLKTINTSSDEYAAVPSIDGKKMFFCGKDRRDNLGGEDVFEANYILKNQSYQIPNIVSSLSSEQGNEAPLSISADGNNFFFWSNENGGDILVSTKLKNGNWSIAERLPYPINSEYYEGDAMLTADGKTIVFVSSRSGGLNLYTENSNSYYGDDNYPTDIYMSNKLENGLWGEPINLGTTINTPYSERSPYLHPDGKTLYFSSEGHGGLGRLDVFKTESIEGNRSKWEKPQNLGKEINSSNNDWGFKFSTDGKSAYYAGKNNSLNMSSLLLLLDISGSMQGQKLSEMKKAAKEVCLEALTNNTEVSIHSFNNECGEPISNTIDFTNDPNSLISFIDNLDAAGGTPMYEALYYVSDYMSINSSFDSKNKSIILMSDGNATSCVTINDLMNELKKNKLIFKVYTIALEVDEYSQAFNDLTLIAQKTGGAFFHAKSSEDLGAAFNQASKSIFNFSIKKSNSDIFQLKLPKDLQPKVVSTVSGVILNSNKEPLEANIYWEDLGNGQNIGTAKTNPVDGSYFIVLPTGRNYGYYVDNKDFFPSSNNLDLTKVDEMNEVQLNVDMVSYKEMLENQKTVIINNLFFDHAKFDLKSESYIELNRVVKILQNYPDIKIEIGGHTDNVGVEVFNQYLSEMRAQSVLNYLISKSINPNQITSKGYSSSKPITDNSTDSKKAKNRRVEIKFIKK